MGLNVLMVSLDSTLSVDEDNVAGNAKARHIEYAKHLESLYIVVKTTKSIKRKVVRIKDNLFIYPTASLNRYFFFYDAYKLASRICKANKIDLIVTQDPFVTGLIGWLLKKKHNIPLNIQVAADMVDNEYFIKESIFNLFASRLSKWLLKKADTIRISSLKEKDKLTKLGIENKKIWYVPFFINFDLFSKNKGYGVRKQYLGKGFDQLILYAGRLAKQKNLETLIQAIPFIIKEYSRVLFLIIGIGPEEIRLQNLALILGIKNNIRFIGNVSYGKIHHFFSACDMFVTTSLYEGTNMALLEAAASGKPVITTPHSGAYDAVEDKKTGFILNFKDPKNIAKNIIYLLKNPGIARKMGEKGQEFILEHFDKDKMLGDYLGMFRETVN